MLHRFIETIRHLNQRSGFEAYLESIQRSGMPGAPSVSEARRDFQSVVRKDTTALLG